MVQLAEDISQSVVGVDAGRRSGTGVIWTEDGLVLTADHVLGRSSEPLVRLSDGRELSAKVIGRDPYTDAALLKVEAGRLKAVKRGQSRATRVGQFVLAFSSASGSKAAATSGVITSPNRSMRGWWGVMIEDAIVSDAKLNPGYSGGPLVDAWGQMLGMNVAYLAGRGLAIPSDSLDEVVAKLLKDGRVTRGFLGVVVEPLNLPGELAKSRGVGQEGGLLVKVVDEGSPAKSAGVAIGDILLKLGGAQTTDEYELHRALSGEVVGKPVSLWVLRGEKPTELEVIPKEAEG